MKHHQFENWILEDTELNRAEHRELQAHLNQCSQCLALYQATHQVARLFKTTPEPVPQPDFSKRWLARMERVERRRNRLILGLTVGGIALATVILLISVGFQLNSAAASFPQMLFKMVSMVANWIVFLNQLSDIAAPLFRVSFKLISPVWLYTIGISLSVITAAWIYALSRSRTLHKEIQS